MVYQYKTYGAGHIVYEKHTSAAAFFLALLASPTKYQLQVSDGSGA
jgi:hypothetical protein